MGESRFCRLRCGRRPNHLVATTGMVLVRWLLARLACRYDWISWLVKEHRVRLIRKAEIDWTAMPSNTIGRRDLLDASLRRNGKITVTLHR